jgi:hypothetical protein
LNFEFLLVLNHDDVTWDPKEEDMGKKKGIFRHIIWKKKKGAIDTL